MKNWIFWFKITIFLRISGGVDIPPKTRFFDFLRTSDPTPTSDLPVRRNTWSTGKVVSPDALEMLPLSVFCGKFTVLFSIGQEQGGPTEFYSGNGSI